MLPLNVFTDGFAHMSKEKQGTKCERVSYGCSDTKCSDYKNFVNKKKCLNLDTRALCIRALLQTTKANIQ